MVHLYALSDVAYGFLINKARECGYVKALKKPQGLSNFINALSYFKGFTDSRPPQVRESDVQRLEINRFPYWTPEYPRKRRYLSLSTDTVHRFATIAKSMGVSNETDIYKRHHTIGSDSALTASFLEALGTQWITSTYWPNNLRPIYNSRRLKTPTKS